MASPSFVVKPMRPPPTAPTSVRNIEVACIATLQERVRCATYTGKFLFTSDPKGVIYQWDTGVTTSVKFHDGVNIPINVMQGANKGDNIWIGFSSGDLAILNIENKTLGTRWKAHQGGVSTIVAMLNSVWSGGVDFQIRKWGMAGEMLFAYAHHHSSIRWLCMVKKDPYEKEMQMWSSSNDPTIAECPVPDDAVQHDPLGDVKMWHTLAVLVLCLVGKNAVWSGSEDSTVRVWSVMDMSLKSTMQGHKGAVCSMVEMGIHVWSGSADATILVWDATTYKLMFSLGDQGGYVKAMVKVDWQLWAFTSGKNIKIWAAASLWDTTKQENSKLKDAVDRFQKEKEAAENATRNLKTDADRREQEFKEQLDKLRNADASDLDAKAMEMQNMKDELDKRLADLEKIKKDLEDEKTRLAKEAAVLKDNLQKLSKDKDTSDSANSTSQAAKDKIVADMEKAMKEAEDQLARTKEAGDSNLSKLEELRRAAEDQKAALQQEIARLKEEMEDEREKAMKEAEEQLARTKEAGDSTLSKLEELRRAAEDQKAALQQEMARLKEEKDDEREKDRKLAEDEMARLQEQMEDEREKTRKLAEDEVARLQEQMEKSRVSEAKTSANADELAEMKKKLEREMDAAKKELAQLKSQMEHEHDFAAKSSNDKDAMNQELQQLREKMDQERNAAQKAAEDTRKAAEDEIAKLRDEMQREKEATTGASENAQATSDEKLAGLEKRLQEALAQLQKAQNAVSSLEMKAAETQKMSDGFANQLTAAEDKNKSFQEALDALEKMKADANNASATATAALNEKMTGLESNLENARDELQKVRDDAAQNALEKDGEMVLVRDGFLQQISDLEQALKNAQEALNAEQESHQIAADAASSLSDQLAEQIEELALQLEDARKEAENASKLAESQASDLAQQLEDAKKQAIAAGTLAESNAAHQLEQLEAAEKKVAEFTKQLEKYKAAIAVVESKAEELGKQLTAAEEKTADLAKQLRAAEEKAADLAKQHEKDKAAAISLAQSRAEELARQLESAKREDAERRYRAEAAIRLAESAAAERAYQLQSARQQGEAASNLAADARETIAGDHAIQKHYWNLTLLSSKSILISMAAEKEMLENELKEAQVANNQRYAINPSAAASQRSSKVIPIATTNPVSVEEIKSEVVLPVSRKYSSTRQGGDVLPLPPPVEVQASRRSSIVIPDATVALEEIKNDLVSAVRRISSSSIAPVEAVVGVSRKSSTVIPEATTVAAMGLEEIEGEREVPVRRNSSSIRPGILPVEAGPSESRRSSIVAMARPRTSTVIMIPATGIEASVGGGGERTSRRVSAAVGVGQLAPALASKKNSSVMPVSRRASTANMPTDQLQGMEVPPLIRRLSSLKPPTIPAAVAGDPPTTAVLGAAAAASTRRRSSTAKAAATSRRGTTTSTTALMPEQLQEKLETLEAQIREAKAKRNTLLAINNNSAGGSSSSDMEDSILAGTSRRTSAVMPDHATRKYSVRAATQEGIIAPAPDVGAGAAGGGGGSRSSMRSRSSQGSRLAEEAVNNERIANLKERVSMLECERERERMAALNASMKFNNSDRDDEMLNRIQQLESALQQAHEDYRLLSQETKQMHNSTRENNKKKCPTDLLRELETDIDRKRHDLELAEFSMKKVFDKYGKRRSTPEKQCTIVDCSPPAPNQPQGNNTSIEFTHLKLGTLVGTHSEINTFSTSGTLGPQWTRIVHQISQNLPQLVLRELGKIAAAGGCPPERETLLPPGSESTRRRALPPAMPPC
ncbi:unnamed protein product [Sphagnum jensenii]